MRSTRTSASSGSPCSTPPPRARRSTSHATCRSSASLQSLSPLARSPRSSPRRRGRPWTRKWRETPRTAWTPTTGSTSSTSATRRPGAPPASSNPGSRTGRAWSAAEPTARDTRWRPWRRRSLFKPVASSRSSRATASRDPSRRADPTRGPRPSPRAATPRSTSRLPFSSPSSFPLWLAAPSSTRSRCSQRRKSSDGHYPSNAGR
mmetsp:Transcript_6774/g.21862  ORF Transcript_6774/g.21862 Transcript_6774/m.21862 type:complete len:205 (-) Transcript_6774:27-641(-)